MSVARVGHVAIPQPTLGTGAGFRPTAKAVDLPPDPKVRPPSSIPTKKKMLKKVLQLCFSAVAFFISETISPGGAIARNMPSSAKLGQKKTEQPTP